MSLQHSNLIEIRRSKGRGRGVFATKFIPQSTIIERVPVIVFPKADLETEEDFSSLYHYVFDWGQGTVAIALGYGSVYNHSFSPNARYDDVGQRSKVFTALRDIQPGEEITVNYNGDPDNFTPMEFQVM